MTMLGVDTAQIVSAEQAKKLADLGYEFVCRYYRRSLSGKWTISHEEARALCDHGMFLVSVFQGDKATMQPAYYNASNGELDAKAALAKARQMRQTPTSAVYFAVDTDITGETVSGVLEYFQVVRSHFSGSQWEVGVYGDDTVLNEVCEKHDLASCAWLANAVGWRADKAYAEWDIKQTSLPLTIMPGLQVDKDEARGFDEAAMWIFS